MSDMKKPPSSQDLTDEIARLNDEVASVKERYATSPAKKLEEALAALATDLPHPMSVAEKGALAAEIQQFKREIAALKDQIAKTDEKLTPPERHPRARPPAAEGDGEPS